MLKHIQKNIWKYFLLGIFLYFIIFSIICFWKYYTLQYNGLDLAIFNQVFFNTSQGNFFNLTIHPHSYLGDHFAIFILFLIPFYSIYKNPQTLLIFQTLFISLSAIPLGLLAKNILLKKSALFIGWLILLLPFVQNANTFEFHLLPIAIFFILFSLYFWQKNQFWYYFIFFILALLIREDVSLVYLGLSMFFLFFQKKKKLRWLLPTLLISLGWFVFTINIMGYFSGYGEYKFLVYYAWLGETPFEMLKTIFCHPWYFISNFISLSDIKLILFVFGSVAFLPLFKLRWLLPSIFIWFQLLLTNAGTSMTIKTHYLSLIIPFLCLASIYGLKNILDNKSRFSNKFQKNRLLLALVSIVIILYGTLTLGPIIPFVKNVISYNKFAWEELKIKKDYINQIDKDDKVVASFDTITNLSSRKYIYSWHYILEGQQQFSKIPFVINENIDKAIFDYHDINLVQISNQEDLTKITKNINNFYSFVNEKKLKINSQKNNFIFFDHEQTSSDLTARECFSDSKKASTSFEIIKKEILDHELKLTIKFLTKSDINERSALMLNIFDEEKNLLNSQVLPLINYFYLTTNKKCFEVEYNLILPINPEQTTMELKIVTNLTGKMTLVDINSIGIVDLQYLELGNPKEI